MQLDWAVYQLESELSRASAELSHSFNRDSVNGLEREELAGAAGSYPSSAASIGMVVLHTAYYQHVKLCGAYRHTNL